MSDYINELIERLDQDAPGTKAKFDAAYEELKAENDVMSRLVEIRRQKRLTQTDVGNRLGLSQSRVCQIESGAESVGIRTIQRYAESIGATITVRAAT